MRGWLSQGAAARRWLRSPPELDLLISQVAIFVFQHRSPCKEVVLCLCSWGNRLLPLRALGDRFAVSVLEAYVHLSERCWLLPLLCLNLIVGDIDFRSTKDLSVNLRGLGVVGRRCIVRLYDSDFIFLQGLHEQLGLMVQYRVRQGHSSPIWSEILRLLLLRHGL